MMSRATFGRSNASGINLVKSGMLKARAAIAVLLAIELRLFEIVFITIWGSLPMAGSPKTASLTLSN